MLDLTKALLKCVVPECMQAAGCDLTSWSDEVWSERCFTIDAQVPGCATAGGRSHHKCQGDRWTGVPAGAQGSSFYSLSSLCYLCHPQGRH